MIYNAVHLYSAEVRTGMRDKGGTWQWPDFACFHGLNCLLNIIFIVIFFISIQVLTNKALSQKKRWIQSFVEENIPLELISSHQGAEKPWFFLDILLQQQ